MNQRRRPVPHDPELLRVQAAADTLSMSVRSVWKHSRVGALPPPIRIGRCTRWRASDLRRWIEARAALTQDSVPSGAPLDLIANGSSTPAEVRRDV